MKITYEKTVTVQEELVVDNSCLNDHLFGYSTERSTQWYVLCEALACAENTTLSRLEHGLWDRDSQKVEWAAGKVSDISALAKKIFRVFHPDQTTEEVFEASIDD